MRGSSRDWSRAAVGQAPAHVRSNAIRHACGKRRSSPASASQSSASGVSTEGCQRLIRLVIVEA
eukprot:3768090-Pyramimonas_sp.AAC.1